MKIYTKTGDSGTTSLIGGRRVAKCDKRIEAYGALDELNAHLGMLVSLTADEDVRVFVEQIQCDLFDIGRETCVGVSPLLMTVLSGDLKNRSMRWCSQFLNRPALSFPEAVVRRRGLTFVELFAGEPSVGW